MTADEIRRQLGLFVTVGYGEAFPGLKEAYTRIIVDKVAAWPWLPKAWIGEYLALQAQSQKDLVRVAPARVVIPAWIDTAEKIAIWNNLAAQLDSVVLKFNQGRVEAGRAEAEAVYANARFWNEGTGAGIIAVATAARDLPANVVGGALDGAGSVVGGLLKRLAGSWIFWALLVGAGAFAAYQFGWIKLPKRKGR